jgi:hypothetical protein
VKLQEMIEAIDRAIADEEQIANPDVAGTGRALVSAACEHADDWRSALVADFPHTPNP